MGFSVLLALPAVSRGCPWIWEQRVPDSFKFCGLADSYTGQQDFRGKGFSPQSWALLPSIVIWYNSVGMSCSGGQAQVSNSSEPSVELGMLKINWVSNSRWYEVSTSSTLLYIIVPWLYLALHYIYLYHKHLHSKSDQGDVFQLPSSSSASSPSGMRVGAVGE